jgi:hypothetical protein
MKSPEFPILVVIGAICAAVIYYLINQRKERVVTLEHPYFSRLWLWPPGSHTRWEAELDLGLPGADEKIGFSAEATHDEVNIDAPTEAEVAFCKDRIADLDRLFELSRPAIEEGWNTWVKKEMPKDWRTVLSLNGLSAPRDGDINKPWGVTYFCEPAGHYFSIAFRDGKPHLESVDG